jgi:hypothetical protein
MFKMFFINLVNINSEITLSLLMADKEYTRLNQITVRIYHKLYGTGK